MKPHHKKILSVGILLVLIVLLVHYVLKNAGEFSQLKVVSPKLLVILLALMVLNYLFIGLGTRILLKPLGVKLGVGEAFALSLVTGFYNLITPFHGGMAIRALYLKKKHRFSYTNFISALSASYVLVFFVISILGIITSLLIYLTEKVFSWIVFLVFLGFFLSLLFLMVFSPQGRKRRNSWINKIIEVVHGWHLIKNNRKAVSGIIVLSLVQTFVAAFMLYLQFKVFGLEIEFVKCLFLTAITTIGIVVSVTPAGLGINEAIVVFSAATIGISATQSLSVALLGRALSLVVLLILGPLFSWVLLKKTNVR